MFGSLKMLLRTYKLIISSIKRSLNMLNNYSATYYNTLIRAQSGTAATSKIESC